MFLYIKGYHGYILVNSVYVGYNLYRRLLIYLYTSWSNEATWCCCKPTCFCLAPLFDLGQWSMLPLTLTLETFYLQVTCRIHYAKSMKITVLTWCPWSLTFTDDLDSIMIHHHTKFGDPNLNTSWDLNFCPVIDRLTVSQSDRKRRIWAHRTNVQVGSIKRKCWYHP